MGNSSSYIINFDQLGDVGGGDQVGKDLREVLCGGSGIRMDTSSMLYSVLSAHLSSLLLSSKGGDLDSGMKRGQSDNLGPGVARGTQHGHACRIGRGLSMGKSISEAII